MEKIFNASQIRYIVKNDKGLYKLFDKQLKQFVA